VQSGNGIIKALNSKYEFKIFSKNELEDDFFDDVQLIAVPGGFGDCARGGLGGARPSSHQPIAGGQSR
jgi:hypothetical protein